MNRTQKRTPAEESRRRQRASWSNTCENLTPEESRDLVWAEVVVQAVDELAWGIAAGYVTIEGELIREAACSAHSHRVGDAIAAAQWLSGKVADRLLDHLGTTYGALRREIKKRAQALLPAMAADMLRATQRQAARGANASAAAAVAAIPPEERNGRRQGTNLKGLRSGRLQVLRRDALVGTHRLWVVRCDCGKEKLLFAQAIKRGRVKSCGCLLAELRNRAQRTSADKKLAGRTAA